MHDLIGVALPTGLLQQVKFADEQLVVLQLDSQVTGGLALAFDEEIIQFACFDILFQIRSGLDILQHIGDLVRTEDRQIVFMPDDVSQAGQLVDLLHAFDRFQAE